MAQNMLHTHIINHISHANIYLSQFVCVSETQIEKNPLTKMNKYETELWLKFTLFGATSKDIYHKLPLSSLTKFTMNLKVYRSHVQY